jgi:hypothetical protein
VTEFRARKQARRVLALLAVARVPLSHGEIWLIIGGSSGAIYRALQTLTDSGRAIRHAAVDDRRVCYSAVIAGLPAGRP